MKKSPHRVKHLLFHWKIKKKKEREKRKSKKSSTYGKKLRNITKYLNRSQGQEEDIYICTIRL